MAKKLEHVDNKLPPVIASLPKKVYEQIVYWSHNTFFNETHLQDVGEYLISVHPSIGSDYDEYSVVRVSHNGYWIYQGWIKLALLK